MDTNKKDSSLTLRDFAFKSWRFRLAYAVQWCFGSAWRMDMYFFRVQQGMNTGIAWNQSESAKKEDWIKLKSQS